VSQGTGPTAADALMAARCGYGWLLACAPRRMIRAGTPRPPGPGAVMTARVLGARHLLQAMATAWAEAAGLPPGPVLLAGAAVDATHAASMVALAAFSRPLRRTALADATLETAMGAAGIMTALRHLAPRNKGLFLRRRG
jgi:hypothetical protein